MRPVPKARHLIAAAVFVTVSVIGGLLAMREQDLTDRQVGMATGAVRAVHEDLYAPDAVYGDSGLWGQDNPVWRWYLCEAYRATGRDDVTQAFSMPVGPLVFVYLVGMYGVLWRQCRSWSVACYTAVLSTAVIHLADGTHWGIGPLATMTPATAALAFVPLLVWAFLMYRNSPGILWVFLGVGLLANLHTATGMSLAVVLTLALIVGGRGSSRSWVAAAAGLLCAAGAASPIIWYHAAQQAALTGGMVLANWAAAFGVESDPARQSVTTIVARALELPSLGYLLALGLPALAVLLRAERYRVRELRVWLGILGGAIGAGVAVNVVISVLGVGGDDASAITGFTQAMRLALLPLYVLLAQGAVHLLRLGASRGVLRASLTALLVVWFVPADNLAIGRHAVEEYLSRSKPVDQQPLELQIRLDRRARSDELRALCQWLADHTSIDTVIACGDSRARLWSRRALVACHADEPYFRMAPAAQRDQWLAAVAQQTRTLRPARGVPADAAALERFGGQYGAAYIILSAQTAPPGAPDDVWITDAADRWGAHWMLYEVDVTGTWRPDLQPPSEESMPEANASARRY